MATLLVILVIAIFVSGSPLFTVMLAGCAVGSAFTDRGFTVGFDGGVIRMFGAATGEQAEILSTIPMFIYMGYLLAEAKTADRLVRFANAALGWVPGGLAIVTILTCALFTVFTGASGVTIIALGGVLMPALVRNGYPKRFSMGLIAGTGSVGLLFPPALPLFIYGAVAGLNIQQHKDWLCTGDAVKDAAMNPPCWEPWDTQRFLFAGIVPGLVLVGMLSAVAVTVAVVRKLPRQKFDPVELVKSFGKALPELIIPFVVIGGLAVGFGPSEIAALTVLYVVILEAAVFRAIKVKTLWDVSREAMAMVGAIFIMIFSAIVFTDYLINEDVPQKMVEWTQSHIESKIAFLLAINIILLIVGTVMDIFSAIVIVLPLVLGIAHAYGIDPYHLGIIFLLNLEVGYLHPPVGLNLFITSVKFQRPITEVMWATIPFLITMIVALLTITYIPSITKVSVPDAERTGKVDDLRSLVHAAVEELSAVKEVALVSYDGKPLLDDAGKPILIKDSECDKLDDQQKIACQGLFFTKKRCSGDPKPDDCAHKAIAHWAKEQMPRVRAPLITVREVALVDDDKNPVKGKDGNAIVLKYGDCDKASDADACKEMFLKVSGCNIDPEGRTVDSCAFDNISKYVRENQ